MLDQDVFGKFEEAKEEEKKKLRLLDLSYDELLDKAATGAALKPRFEAAINELMGRAAQREKYIHELQENLRAVAIKVRGMSEQAKRSQSEISSTVDELSRQVNEIASEFANAPKEFAKSGARARLEKDSDGKQGAKVGAFQFWQRWQQEPHLYEGPTAWASDMREKFSVLESTASIMNWHRTWKATDHEIRDGLVVKKTPSN